MSRWNSALLWAVPALLIAAAPGQSSAQPNSSAEQLAWNMARGDQLYAYDQSAWHATDAALAALSDEAKSQLRGYITTPSSGGLRTTFFGESDDGYYRLYSSVWTGSANIDTIAYPSGGRVPVDATEKRLIDARSIALASQTTLTMCSTANPNVIVIPGAAADQPISVYILTPQTKNEVYPMGGHHRIDVKGGKIVASRDFTRSCLDVERPGSNAVALGVTHLLDPIPTEIHAFMAHAANLPVMVGVSNGDVFEIDLVGGKASAKKIGNVKAPPPQS